MMRRFELSDGVSSKFWEVGQAGCELHIRFGRIGTAGQSKPKTFADDATAAAALVKLVREKTAKGYVEAGAGGGIAVVGNPAAAPATPVAVGDIAPWLACGPVLDLPPGLAALALPSRQAPGPAPITDAARAWDMYLQVARPYGDPAMAICDVHLHAGLNEAMQRIRQGTRSGSMLSDTIMFAIAAQFWSPKEFNGAFPFLDFLAAEKGLPYAVDVMLTAMQELSASSIRASAAMPNERWQVRAIGRDETLTETYYRIRTKRALHQHLVHANEATWNQCMQTIGERLAGLPAACRVHLAPFQPDAPLIALRPLPEQGNETCRPAASLSQMYATLANARALVMGAGRDTELYRDSALTVMATLIREHGADVATLLHAAPTIELGTEALTWIGTPLAIHTLGRELVEASRGFFRQPAVDARQRLREVVRRWPLAAIAGLAQLIATEEQVPHAVHEMLATLAYEHLAVVPAFRPWITATAAAVLDELSTSFTDDTLAADADLPPVLANPPWLAPRKKTVAAMSLAPLPLASVAHWSDEEREDMRMEERETLFTYASQAKAPAHSAAAIAAGDTAGLVAIWQEAAQDNKFFAACVHLIADLPPPFNAAVWNATAGHPVNSPGYAVATLGLSGLPALVTMCEQRPGDDLVYARYIAAVELAAPVARAYATLKTRAVRAAARQWLLAYPEHTACALIAPALGKAGSVREQAADVLRMLAAAGHDTLLMEVAARYQQPAVGAALRALLDQDRLDLYPAKLATVPDFWAPRSWPRPRLASNGKALPDAAIDALGAMLRFAQGERVYAGLTQVRAACTPDSLAAFAWDLFIAWQNDGGSARENWAFTALGVLGDDDIARKLGPLVRAWPADALHARAAFGVDVLGAIGTDVALLELRAISRRFNSGTLKESAHAKIVQIAEARGMSADELEDHLTPELGLDEQGTLLLDFGARQFLVGFDEALRPYVLDPHGAHLADLPKPRKDDDAELARAAVVRYKQLKKDVRAVALQQVTRLEMAMRTRRRWSPEKFMTFMAGHALVRHLAQRVVWAAYRDARVEACFRLTPDGSFADGADDTYVLPQDDGIRIGIPHPLDMTAADLAAFTQLLTDYELMQPFSQLDRDTYALAAAEMTSDRLLRWDGVPAASGAILGLGRWGWRRGRTQERSYVHDFSKAMADGRVALLSFEPGIMIAATEEHPEQTLRLVLVGSSDQLGYYPRDPVALAQLDPVDASELIRDIEHLRA
ncbi:DUF4132 domain-containing protein [Massilia sp. CCM 8694]|uniref:DUF4132 domain-containing protein n=2 Tax=Massilia genomosp. 1 TaxID=2609280 RepID=A0ABX0MUY3_9BURK|nr:DUF4132 domain-containing protein [Massilia genomosp. 1]